MTNSSDQPQTFTSQPLASYQAGNDTTASVFDPPTPRGASDGGAALQARPAPVLDIHFDDLPNEDYGEFNFPLRTTPGVIFTLGVDDDAVLFQIMDVAQDGSPNDIIDYFFKATFRRAVDEHGVEIPNGLRFFQNAINGGKPGERESRRYLMSVVTTAIDHWTEELTDTSARPMNRAQRRARRR